MASPNTRPPAAPLSNTQIVALLLATIEAEIRGAWAQRREARMLLRQSTESLRARTLSWFWAGQELADKARLAGGTSRLRLLRRLRRIAQGVHP